MMKILDFNSINVCFILSYMYVWVSVQKYIIKNIVIVIQ